MTKKIILSAIIYTLCSTLSFAQHYKQWGNWMLWGDQGDATYVNPILPSDYSDLDCIRVGDSYYAITSTFQFSPGMTILHSKDLVNWEICGNAVSDLTQIGKELDWTRMNRYGKGIWAGTLRHHNNRFYLFFGTPDEGYFMTSAEKPEGPWEPLTQLLAESGWDDCAVMWDEDGKACFVGTQFSAGYKTYLFNMSADGKKIYRETATLINEGNGREANKLIKVNGWYYLIFSEHKDGIGRYVMAKRSKKMTGPYEEEKQIALPSREAMEPNQGGIVLGRDGNWYFLTHHGSGDWSGRIMSLLPVTWIDNWPIIGKVLPQDIGTMQWEGAMPYNSEDKLSIGRSDDFDNKQLSPQWQWNYQPRKENFSLTERPGWLRLKAFRPLKENDLMRAGNTLTQRTFRTSSNRVVIKMDISKMADGQKSGLSHFSSQHAAIGIVKDGDAHYIEYRKNGQIERGSQVSAQNIWLRSEWGLEGKSQFSYSTDGDNYTTFGEVYQLVWGNYRGDRIGIYCFNDLSDKGLVDIDYLHHEIAHNSDEIIAPKPVFRDPVYDGAADPIVIYNPLVKKWWMYYTNRRVTETHLPGVSWVHGTPIGIAESEDGANWKYIGIANFPALPAECGGDSATLWAPDVISDGNGVFHMYLTVVPGISTRWGLPGFIGHFTSRNLRDWKYESRLSQFGTQVLDADILQMKDGTWRLYYKDQKRYSNIRMAESKDLYTWSESKEIVRVNGEGPIAFKWKDYYWLLIDVWAGQKVYRSNDGNTWEEQPGNNLMPYGEGTGNDDIPNALHANVVVGDRTYMYYFTHPGRVGENREKDGYDQRRTSIQVVELKLTPEGWLTADRNRPTRVRLTPTMNAL